MLLLQRNLMYRDMNVIQLNEDDFLRVIADYRNPHGEWKYQGNRPAIVDFYAAVFECLDPILRTFRIQHDRNRHIQILTDTLDQIDFFFVFFMSAVGKV